MKERIRNNLIKYGVSVAVAALIVWRMLATHGYAAAETDAERFRLLCDAFTVPGLLMLLSGALIALSNAGALYGLSYSMRFVIRKFIPSSGKRDESFYDFVQERRERGGVRGYAFLLVVGGILLLIAVVFLILFYRQ